VTCPRCRQQTKVVKTEPCQGGAKARLRRCPQHGAFWTKSVEKVTEWVGETLPATVARNGNDELPATANDVAQPLVGDLGGPVLADSSPSLKPLIQRRSRERTYPAAFEAEWALTAKTGSKDKAEELWIKLGKPPFGLAWKAWEQSPQWMADWYNYPHVCKWLRDGRWKQDPTEARVKATPAKTVALPFALAAEEGRQQRATDSRIAELTERLRPPKPPMSAQQIRQEWGPKVSAKGQP
jgi:hypothetical protein